MTKPPRLAAGGASPAGIQPTLHASGRRCSSLDALPTFSAVVPCRQGASSPPVRRRGFHHGLLALFAPLVVAAALLMPIRASQTPAPTRLELSGERHLRNVRQLTNGAENAEAYFSFDGKKLIFQSTAGHSCDQIYTMNVDGSDRRLVSTGKGRTACSFYYPDGKSILYASTHGGGDACPQPPSLDQGYVWPIYESYDIYRANPDGSNLVPLTTTAGYDAEATIAKDGRIVFTSVRDGDMEIYSMNGDGSDVRRLTNMPGPDGGPFFSADGKRIVFRGRHPQGPELEDYRSLLERAIYRPTSLEIYVMNRDGSGLEQVTKLGAASFAPYFTPDGRQIIFSSNYGDPKGRNFDLFLVNVDGTGLERVTHNDTFDGFPMYSPDGRTLVFASNRHDAKPGETNIFVADWVK
jgi:Tol biopolymer transport system component